MLASTQGMLQAATRMSTPVALTAPFDLLVATGVAVDRPRALSVRAMSSLSIRSRVVLVSSSTSAAVRPVVGIGSRTEESKS